MMTKKALYCIYSEVKCPKQLNGTSTETHVTNRATVNCSNGFQKRVLKCN